VTLDLVFAGTPEFAVPALRRLASETDFRIRAVITQPDRPRGRGQQQAEPAVKQAALAAGLPVYQPEKLKTDSAFDFLSELAPDAAVIMAYGRIIPPRLLAVPRLGWINLHASLLPKYRGAAPINWAIVNGETISGVTTMRIDAGLDTGDLLEKQEMAIGRDETAPELTARMAEAGAELLVRTLRRLERGQIIPTPQEHARATLAPPLTKEDGRISWSANAQQIYNRIRGLQPWPGAFTTFRAHGCRVWGRPAEADLPSAACGTIIAVGGNYCVACGRNSWLRLEAVQLEGRKRVAAHDFANGARLEPGEGFST
jgi:methionyl-tRNA formyltransferase